MHRYKRITILLLLAVTILGSCSRQPDHTRYIPKDAVAVAGINLRGLGKKIAWNMITGSKLFKEMQSRIPEKSTKDAMDGIEKAGIDLANTLYVYVKPDTRFKGGNRITGLVPLSDAAQWEAYVKRVFPNVEIKQNGGHKEASLGRDMFVGWNNNLLVIINVMSAPADYNDLMEGRGAQGDRPTEDMASLSAEMNVAFSVTQDNSITTNARFTALEAEGHDVTFWLNYGQLMSEYGSDMSDRMGGVSLSGALWKNAAFTSGFDFRKGKITGDMRYYMPDEMKEIGNELGSANIDKDMLGRLPGQNMDVLVAMHIAPKGIKSILEKMGMLGLANTALAQQNMNVDDIFDAFTGDMSFVINDFSLHSETVTESFMGETVTHTNQKPTLSMSYVMKLGKKEKFQKLLAMAKQNGPLQPMGSGFVIPIDENDSVYLMADDQYMVASNKSSYANGFLQGSYKSQKMPDAATQVTAHPWALYLDMQLLLKNIDAGINHSAHDSAMIVESKKLLNNISLSGGEFKNSAFEYHLDINFTNTEENSIIELMDYGMKMNEADKIAQ